MSLADDPQSNVPPESSEATDPLNEAGSPDLTEAAPVEESSGKKRKKKKEKKKREKPAREVAETEEGEPSRKRFSLADLDIYTVMLIIAFGFLSVACVLMWIELYRYGFNFTARG